MSEREGDGGSLAERDRGDDRHRVHVRLTPKQFELARRRLYAEHLSWQTVLSASVNAFILGDLAIEPSGHYRVVDPPPEQHADPHAVAEVEAEGHDEPVELAIAEPTPADTLPDPADIYALESWGLQEVVSHLIEEAGSALAFTGSNATRELARYLRHLGLGVGRGSRYTFDGPDDETVVMLVEHTRDGKVVRWRDARLDRAKSPEQTQRRVEDARSQRDAAVNRVFADLEEGSWEE